MAQTDAQLQGTESAWRLIAASLGWQLLAFACGGGVGLLVLQLGGFFRDPKLSDVVTIAWYAEILVSSGVLLAAAVIRGRIVGSGSINIGLGNGPMSNTPVIIGLAAALVAYAALLRFVFDVSALHGLSHTSPSVGRYAISAFLFVLIVPLAEESLFRGWLWTGLQRQWDVLPTALLTSITWLAAHITPHQMMVLLPVAIILALARYYGKSMRAPLALHMTYNAASIAALWVSQA